MAWKEIWAIFFGSTPQTKEEPKREPEKFGYAPSLPPAPRPRAKRVVERGKPTILSKKQQRRMAARKRRHGEPLPLVKVEVRILTEEDIYALIPIEEFLSVGINARCVKAIIVWFWRRKAIGGNVYLRFQHARDNVVGKGFSPMVFEESFVYLDSLRLILRHKAKNGNGEEVISLRVKIEASLPSRVNQLIKVIAKGLHDLDMSVRR